MVKNQRPEFQVAQDEKRYENAERAALEDFQPALQDTVGGRVKYNENDHEPRHPEDTADYPEGGNLQRECDTCHGRRGKLKNDSEEKEQDSGAGFNMGEKPAFLGCGRWFLGVYLLCRHNVTSVVMMGNCSQQSDLHNCKSASK